MEPTDDQPATPEPTGPFFANFGPCQPGRWKGLRARIAASLASLPAPGPGIRGAMLLVGASVLASYVMLGPLGISPGELAVATAVINPKRGSG